MKGISMSRMMLATLLAGVTLTAAPMAMAQQGPGQGKTVVCQPGKEQHCQQQTAGKKIEGKKTKATQQQAAKGPRVGDSGRSGKPFQRADNSRFKAPPKGQDYRVVNNTLVLVDSKTLQIVTVLGLLDTLLK